MGIASDQDNLLCLSLFCFYPLNGNGAERLSAFETNALGSWRDQPAKRTHPLRSKFLAPRLKDHQQLSKEFP
jgi:hypothetical protein